MLLLLLLAIEYTYTNIHTYIRSYNMYPSLSLSLYSAFYRSANICVCNCVLCKELQEILSKQINFKVNFCEKEMLLIYETITNAPNLFKKRGKSPCVVCERIIIQRSLVKCHLCNLLVAFSYFAGI